MGNLYKIIVATGFEWLSKEQKTPNLATLLSKLLSTSNTKVVTIGNQQIYFFGWIQSSKTGGQPYYSDIFTRESAALVLFWTKRVNTILPLQIS